MGNHSTSMTPPNAQGRQPPAGSREAYGGVRLEAMTGGDRIVNDLAAAAGNAGGGRRRMHGSWAPNPPTGPQTVVQKTKMVRNACHVRKDTVRLVPPNFQPSGQEEYSSSSSICGGGRFHLSFRFDATVPCNVAVFWVATEGKDEAGGLCHKTLMSVEEEWVVGPHRFEAGANQMYSTAALGYQGADLLKASLEGEGGRGVAGGKVKSNEKEDLSVFIVLRPCVEEDDDVGQGKEGKERGEVFAQVTVMSLTHSVKIVGSVGERKGKEDAWVGRVVKQKIETPDGVFVLQDIYGIAGSMASAGGGGNSESGWKEGDDGGASKSATAEKEEVEQEINRAECVVCLTNKRELAILPCRHMCVCRACAAECIQSQDSRCPICRNPAHALLKLTLDEDDHYCRSSASPHQA